MISTKIVLVLLVTVSLQTYIVEVAAIDQDEKLPEESSIDVIMRRIGEEQFQNETIDKNGTIDEVKRLLELDPSLPRLSDSEIIELFENITTSDNEAAPKLEESNHTSTANRTDHQRAIMYVMPYTPKNFSDIQELYNKPPVTHLVGKENENKTTQRPIRTRLPPIHKMHMKPQNNVNIRVHSESGFQRPTTDKPNIKTEFQKSDSHKVPTIRIPNENVKIPFTQIKIIPTTTTSKPFKFKPKIDPVKVYITEEPTTSTTTTKRPQIQRGTIRYPNHKYPEELKVENHHISITEPPPQVMKIIDPPKLVTMSKIEPQIETIPSDHWQQNKYKPGIVIDADISEMNSPVVSSKRRRPYPQKEVSLIRPAPEINSHHHQPSPFKMTTEKPVPSTAESVDFGIPDNFKEMIQNIDLSSSESKKNTAGKFSSTYTSATFPNNNKIVTPPPMKENVKEILASIGLFPQEEVITTTTTTYKPDLSVGAEGLDPEMRELLMTFGLIPNPKENQAPLLPTSEDDYPEPSKPSVSAESYSSFKPLPDTAPTRQDMESFLSKFGLLDSQRSQKAVNLLKNSALPEKTDMKTLTNVPKFDEDMIPESMKDVLEDIGLTTRRDRRIKGDSQRQSTENIKQHVFNPEAASTTNEELKKLDLLLSTIKQLEKLNGTISQSDLDSLDLANIKEITESINNSMNKTMKVIPLDQLEDDDLNPVSLEELQHLFKVKTDFKRQNENVTVIKENVTITVEEPQNPPLSELAASFPGTTDTDSSPVVPDEALPPPRRNGFYFLLDWNSFLEVGEDGKNKVNIRIAPKVGDPSRFIEVKVP